jgi:hypothetical protein
MMKRRLPLDREGYRIYLKKRGKQPHVIEGLIRQVERFEQFLSGKSGKGVDSAHGQDIRDYVADLESRKLGSAKDALRGLALYFHFAGKNNLAAVAADLREQAIARTRKSFPLRDFIGLDPAHVAALETAGIATAKQMLEAGRTPRNRQELADRLGVPVEAILEMVKLCDLSRLMGVKSVRARLYHDAGVDTVEKLASQEPDALLRLTAEFVARTGFDGIAPLPKEVRSTIASARKLPKIVEY